MSTNRRFRIAFLTIPILVGLAGCSKASVQPIYVGPGPGANFSLPESTLATFAGAVHSRSTSIYGACFADTIVEQREFHAAFDSSDLTAFLSSGGTPPADWARSQELSFFPDFVAYLPTALYDLAFTVDTGRGGIINIGGPTQKHIYNLHYRVWSGVTPVCAGSAGITLERVGLTSEYKITHWDDRRDSVNVRTWGMARLIGG